MKGNLSFLLCFTLYFRANSKYNPPGGLYLEGRFSGGFFAWRFWGAYIWRGLFSEFYSTILTEKVPSSFIYLLLTKYGTPLHTYSLEPCMIPFYYIDTDKIPGFFLLLKNHIFITFSEDTIFIFHVWGYWGRYGY